MIAVLAALAAAISYGVGDVVGGIASRRISAVRVVALSSTTSMLLFVPITALVGGSWSREAVLWGAASGITNAVAIGLLYAALAIGPMSVLSPITALLAAAVPLVFGIAAGEQVGPLGAVGLVVGLGAILLASLSGDAVSRPSARGLAAAVGSGLAIGVSLILLDHAPHDSGMIPVLFNRAGGSLALTTAVVVLALLARRRSGTPLSAGWRGGLLLGPLCGVIDTISNTGTLLGLRLGDLGVTAVVISLYPVTTILIARLALHERLRMRQWVGVALAVVAVILLALP